ncbi:hypothetical protein QKQ66_gp140 [Dione juno nucleopolyhedrovirus]|uniref:Uncharacterized protein n=1 Tax=Dione juno nucleopolyhedrovirus TaxID=2594175 RepID=A0AAE6LCL8_9ABAC|nr:hypothetical protein QKQ66_gp140 [Dione juno nucleopolyhedrovirus]QDL57074.1 hypothetical protein DijuNPV-ORF-140 [Dione juno nucleopolyhedrovirus]
MDIIVTLVPINLRGVEEPKLSENFKLTRMRTDAEFCLTVKCRSPFAKFKVLISVGNFEEAHLQITVCSRSDAVCVVNAPGQRQVVFDGFAKRDDEGATVPLVVGPLFAAQRADDGVRAAVHAINQQQTAIKMFINQAYLKNVWGALRNMLYSDNHESDLANNVDKYISVDETDVVVRGTNASQWVPAINYVTGRQLLTVLFIFKFN